VDPTQNSFEHHRLFFSQDLGVVLMEQLFIPRNKSDFKVQELKYHLFH